ncbi:MAG: tRNA uridine-5-carboxymethylaminomethyl(34) synthesis enzyme MnmG [Novosphingobium sp.]|nr:tRNA uridine-5-carboxymethylaminomethyl(34) synthesis enzyme MnmG [Novosphingobium sp.]
MSENKFNNNINNFDVIVVGGGHAGIEAAYISAKMGSKTLMVTLSLDKIGHMPCNPAIGGIGKSHIVFEISALGGLMPQLCTKTYLQVKMLNTKKGPAVQGLRLQIDKEEYKKLSQEILKQTPNLTIVSDMVESLVVEGDSENKIIKGIKTRSGVLYNSKTVILTTGTFLRGLIHVGHNNYSSGRQGEEASHSLALSIKNLGLDMVRLKTGTPARLLRSSLDFSQLDYQGSDNLDYLFEFDQHKVEHKIGCYITYTNKNTHDIITQNAHLSPIYTGHIKGTPPRYCPSIEDKISRFKGKDAHHVFVEPESASSDEVYPNGLSTALPLEIQEQYIRTIKGFEKAIIARPGYAIEYDAILPNQLSYSLEVKKIKNLFLAGQINGTTGYEEAAGQGIMAGINASLKVNNKEPFILSRTESYIGVMIDDLVTMSIDEPYRMFTSRAERRLLLRQDNVFDRLGDKSYALGLISQDLYNKIEAERDLVKNAVGILKSHKNYIDIMRLFSTSDIDIVNNKICTILKDLGHITHRPLQSISAQLLYEPYIKREEKEIEKFYYYQSLEIPEDINYSNMPGLSIEMQQKLIKFKPKNIAQANLIQGMTPAAISILIFKSREIIN